MTRFPVPVPLRERVRAAACALHAMLGVPDYERYRAHVTVRHPECTPLTREEFARERLDLRYSRPGARCC